MQGFPKAAGPTRRMVFDICFQNVRAVRRYTVPARDGVAGSATGRGSLMPAERLAELLSHLKSLLRSQTRVGAIPPLPRC